MAEKSNTQIVRSVYDAFNRREIDRLLELVSDDAEWTVIPNGQKFKGKQGFREYLQFWLKAFPDGRIEVLNQIEGGDYVVTEFLGRGTHQGPLEGPSGTIPASGNRIELHYCEILEMKDGKMVRGHAYFDMATLMNQLGVEKLLKQAG